MNTTNHKKICVLSLGKNIEKKLNALSGALVCEERTTEADGSWHAGGGVMPLSLDGIKRARRALSGKRQALCSFPRPPFRRGLPPRVKRVSAAFQTLTGPFGTQNEQGS